MSEQHYCSLPEPRPGLTWLCPQCQGRFWADARQWWKLPS